MKQLKENWTREELKAYLALFCLNTNCTDINEEIDFSVLNITNEEFKTIEKEFKKDNDYQSIQKIANAIEQIKCVNDCLSTLFQEIKEFIISSGRKYNYLMKNLFLGFERTLIETA